MVQVRILCKRCVDVHFRGQLLVEEGTEHMDLTGQLRVAILQVGEPQPTGVSVVETNYQSRLT